MSQKVLFRHCDPAGIVFYPRYFEMLNDLVEAFFDRALGVSFAVLHRSGAVPTVAIEATFHAPSRHGDALDFTLEAGTPGRSSLALSMTALCSAERRLSATSTLVHVDAAGRPAPWPEAIRQRLTQDERH